MKKLERIVDAKDEFYGWAVRCPACDTPHVFDNRWTFDGNMDAPTFSPSMLSHGTGDGRVPRCHSFLEAGKWEYLADCEHAFAGQTIDVPEFSY